MRILVELHSDRPVVLPVGYNSLIRDLILTRIDADDDESGYDDAFAFSLSLAKGAFDRTAREFIYRDGIRFYASSPDNASMTRLAESLARNPRVRLGGNDLLVRSAMAAMPRAITGNRVRVRALTPATAYGPISLKSGETRTCFFTPFEDEFTGLTNAHLARLWRRTRGSECPHALTIRPLFHGTGTLRTVHYGTDADRIELKAWWGMYELGADPEFLAFTLDCGIGIDTSKGYGFVEAVSS